MRTIAIIPLLMLAVLASCNDNGGDTQPEHASAPRKASSSDPVDRGRWNVADAPMAGTALTITPNPVDLCTEKLAVVDVAWDVSAAAPRYVQVWVVDKGGEKLWLSTRETAGSRRTGRWVKSGVKFLAVDPSSRKLINTAEVGVLPCR